MKRLLQLISVLSLILGTSTVFAQTAPEIIGENPPVGQILGYGWESGSWPAPPSPVSVTTIDAFKGTQSVQMNFNAAWSGFSPHTSVSSGPFKTAGYRALTFAVYNVSNAHQLYLRATKPDGTTQTNPSIYLPDYSPTNSIPPGQWTWIRIPIADLKLGVDPQILFFAIQSAFVGQAYFDEMRFEGNATLYEGVKGTNGPSVQRWSWGTTVTSSTANGNTWLNVQVTQNWGGIQFHVVNKNIGTMPASHFSHLTVHFQKTVSWQTVNARLVGDNNAILGSVNLESYVPGGAQVNKWYRAVIPLGDFGVSSQNLTGVVIDSGVTGTFLIDEVKFINSNFAMNFAFPLQSGYPQGAYTATKINSVLDHKMDTPYSDKTGTILAFTGEYFYATTQYPAGGPSACYPKAGWATWSSFLANIYKGTSGSGQSNCASNVALNYEAHPGYDYVASFGTDVRAAASGVVVNNTVATTGENNTLCVPKGMKGLNYQGCAEWGAVGIDHGNGYITQYLHMSSILVAPGQAVIEGQLIGKSGQTGGVPEHLHFEVLKVRPSYSNDYQPGNYATVDPYGFNTASGAFDYLANQNGVPSVCLWKCGCRFQ